jgi:hypothetical protein
MHRTIITLDEYRTCYPDSAARRLGSLSYSDVIIRGRRNRPDLHMAWRRAGLTAVRLQIGKRKFSEMPTFKILSKK